MTQTQQHKLRYNRSINGFIVNIHAQQRRRSRLRNMPQPTYSKDELKEWFLKQDLFKTLYENWVSSNYDKNLTPSVDRKDDYMGYTLNNIQLMTWIENKQKHYQDKIIGNNNKISKAVEQYSKSGVLINTYFSTMEAERNTQVIHNNISSCCKGQRKSAGGFIWKYK